MSDTTFVPGTVITKEWLNDVNDSVYSGAPAAGTNAATTNARTTAEIAASVIPTVYAWPEGDIRRYGATTASGNNATAINNALLVSANAGAAVYIPPGIWTYTSTLNATLSSSMYGDGQNSILNPNGCDGITFTNQTSYAGTRFFRDFFLSATSGTTSTGINANMTAASGNRITGITFTNLSIQNFKQAVFARGIWNSAFNDCFLYNNYQGYYFHGQNIQVNIHRGWVQRGTITGSGTTYGVLVDQVSGESSQDIHLDQLGTFQYDVGVSWALALFSSMHKCTINECNLLGIQIVTTSYSMVVRDNWVQMATTGVAATGIKCDSLGASVKGKTLIDGNVVIANTYVAASVGIYIGDNQDAVTVTNNRIPASGTNGAQGSFEIGIQTAGCNNTIIRDNSIYAETTARYINSSGTDQVVGPDFIEGSAAHLLFTSTTPPGFSYYDSGSFTITLTGMTASTTGTVQWRANGRSVTLTYTSSITGTSNTTAMTGTGLPTYLAPETTVASVASYAYLTDNSVRISGLFDVSTAGVITFYNGPTLAAWTAAGTKGIRPGTFTYPLS